MKILTVVGARPQFIKAAVVSRELAQRDIKEVLVHTGQHYDANMSDVFFEELSIPRPDYNLGIGGGTHGQNTGRMLEDLERLMQAEAPDWVLVYGDTDSTLAGALAAAKLHIRLAHVEAGLRSHNRRMPEEVNRVLTDHISNLLFAPTEGARANLIREGISEDLIHVVGDVMYDASLYYKEYARAPDCFDTLGIETFALCTIHRAENTDSVDRMAGILQGLGAVDLPIILPLHPRTRKQLASGGLKLPPNISVIEPVGYLEMVWLEMHCQQIITDSGGVQKEAYFHEKPCVTLRDETEWTELLQGQFNLVVGADPARIAAAIRSTRNLVFDRLLYGDGHTARNIIEKLIDA